jgi:serine/threonine protein kinase
MSSGELPQEVYHRASTVGSGSYGSVMIVYDDEGDEYALKVFDEDDDGNDEDDDSDDGGGGSGGVGGIELGALREVSILRIFRGHNEHPNIIAIHDVQAAFGGDDDNDGGEAVGGVLAMAMPLFPEGSLASAFSKITSKKQKAIIAHGILCAVAHLHSHGIMHRDIKSDNILLKYNDDSDNDDDILQPVLIDFSLAKMTEPALLMGISSSIKQEDVLLSSSSTNAMNNYNDGPTHSPSVGTPTYRAPEVIHEQPYGLKSDLWSVGVVLLELLRGECLEVFKDKGALTLVKESLEKLPEGQPYPSLLRGLLESDPSRRWTAEQALQCELFEKFGLSSINNATSNRIYLPEALPLEYETDMNVDDVCRPLSLVTSIANNNISHQGKENQANEQQKEKKSSSSSSSKTNKKSKTVDPKLQKRFKLIQKICSWMEWNNPLTAHAAMTYSQAMAELVEEDDDEDGGGIDDISENQTLLDCIVVAHKFFETDLSRRQDVNAMYQQFAKTDFDVNEFSNNEETLFMMMDFCLYPRTLGLGY